MVTKLLGQLGLHKVMRTWGGLPSLGPTTATGTNNMQAQGPYFECHASTGSEV